MNEYRPLKLPLAPSSRIAAILAQLWHRRAALATAAILIVASLAIMTASDDRRTWTASALVRLGTSPDQAILTGEAARLTVPVEKARETLARLSGGPFRAEVLQMAQLAPQTRTDSEKSFRSSLRGELVSDELIRLRVTAASRADSYALLSGTIAKLASIHAEMRRQRVQQLERLIAAQRAAPPEFTSNLNESSLRAALASANSAVEPTGIMYGTEIEIYEPAPVSRWQSQIAAIFGMLIATVLLGWAAIGRGLKA